MGEEKRCIALAWGGSNKCQREASVGGPKAGPWSEKHVRSEAIISKRLVYQSYSGTSAA